MQLLAVEVDSSMRAPAEVAIHTKIHVTTRRLSHAQGVK